MPAIGLGFQTRFSCVPILQVPSKIFNKFKADEFLEGTRKLVAEVILTTANSSSDPIQCRERVGGMLNFYYREAP